MRAILAAAILGTAMPAAADSPSLRPADRDRLDRFEEAAGAALLPALSGGAQADVAVLALSLSGPARTPSPEGDWACRTIRLGGPAPLVVYTPFRCRITRLGPTEWRFEKLTGSQRTRGIIAFEEGRAIYRGVGFTGEAPDIDYEALPRDDAIADPGQTIAQVAVFEQTSESRARLMFPYPLADWDFDILELTR